MSITYKLKVPRGQQIKINKAFVIQELMNIDGKVFFITVLISNYCKSF